MRKLHNLLWEYSYYNAVTFNLNGSKEEVRPIDVCRKIMDTMDYQERLELYQLAEYQEINKLICALAYDYNIDLGLSYEN